MEETKFDKLGVFMYSKEDGTKAAKMEGQIHFQTKKKRWKKIMELQRKISEEKLKEKIGQTYTVLVENITKDNKYIVGRSYMDTLDEDGLIYIKNNKKAQIGDFIECKITGVKNEYDLIGE